MFAAIAAALYARRAAVATEETVGIAREGVAGATEALAIADRNAAAAVKMSEAAQEANKIAREAQRKAASEARWAEHKARREKEKSDARTDAAYAVAERNAQAVADQVELARDTASKQLRAYIGVLWANAYYVGAPLSRVVIQIKNYGQTPAFDVTSRTGLYIDTHQTGFPGKRENGSTVIFAQEFGIVEPGQERIIWIDLPDDWIRENIEALRNGEVRLFSETKIRYSDVGGVDRFREFCCYLPDLRSRHNRRDPGAIPMTITAGGNVDSWVGQWAKVHRLPPLDEGATDDASE